MNWNETYIELYIKNPHLKNLKLMQQIQHQENHHN